MGKIIFLIVCYVLIMFSSISIIWGKGTDVVYKFQKDMFFVRIVGKKFYYFMTKLIAILAMIGVNIGVIAVIISEFKKR